jgi:hypothetical protein
MEKINLKTVLEYIYNRVYRIFKSFLGENNRAPISSCMFLSLLLVFTLDILINLHTRAREVFLILDGFLYLVFGIFFALIIYFFTVYKSKYLRIIKKFENEKTFSKILGNIIVLSISSLVFALALRPIFSILKELYGN